MSVIEEWKNKVDFIALSPLSFCIFFTVSFFRSIHFVLNSKINTVYRHSNDDDNNNENNIDDGDDDNNNNKWTKRITHIIHIL